MLFDTLHINIICIFVCIRRIKKRRHTLTLTLYLRVCLFVCVCHFLCEFMHIVFVNTSKSCPKPTENEILCRPRVVQYSNIHLINMYVYQNRQFAMSMQCVCSNDCGMAVCVSENLTMYVCIISILHIIISLNR